MIMDLENQAFELFLIGDTGDISTGKADPVLKCLCAHFDVNQPSAVIFLGDNIYPRGLPPKGHLLRRGAELVLEKHHAAVKDYHGKVLFIAGNHDWNKGRSDGFECVRRQEKFLEKLFGGKNVFLPSNGCPGPAVVDIGERIAIIAIDTQWWMQKGYRPAGPQDGCRVNGEEDFFEQFEQAIVANSGKTVIVAGHHPIYSYAIHGGRFKLKHHIFPLTIYDKNAWLPLPGLGSLLPLYRKLLGAREDMAHPRYRRFRARMKDILERYPGIIYAAGHEHNLQYIEKKGNHFIVSGSGSKVKYVVQSGKYLRYGHKHKGFFKLRIEPDGSVELSAWCIDTSGIKEKGEREFVSVISGRRHA